MDECCLNFDELLKDKGYKLTTQRRVVLDVVLENKGKHLNRQEIFDLVRKKNPDIGVATVFRTLPLLEEMGIVDGVDFGDGCIRYEIKNHELQHRHHHLICMKCNQITEVKEDLLDSIEDRIFVENSFKVLDHRVKFYGYCKACLDKVERK